MTGRRSGPRRGIVLGAGGVLGAAWMIGALSALHDAYDWEPHTADVLVGTSAGSVLAALLGSGITADTLANNQRGIVAPGDPALEFDPDTTSGGALPGLPRLGIGSPAPPAPPERPPPPPPPPAPGRG